MLSAVLSESKCSSDFLGRPVSFSHFLGLIHPFLPVLCESRARSKAQKARFPLPFPICVSEVNLMLNRGKQGLEVMIGMELVHARFSSSSLNAP